MQATKKVQVECGKCNGKGKIRGFEHIAHGDCFACCGEGKIWVPAESNYVEHLSEIDAKRVKFMKGLTASKWHSLAKDKQESILKWCKEMYETKGHCFAIPI